MTALMSKQQPNPVRYVQPYRYPSPNIPMSAIRRFARRIAERFEPQKIILFGSYAYGTPHEESDVDLLVVMPTRNAMAESVRISLAFERPFSLDLIVRTPGQIERGLRPDDCDWFLREVIEKGKILYEVPQCPVQCDALESQKSCLSSSTSFGRVPRNVFFCSRQLLLPSGSKLR